MNSIKHFGLCFVLLFLIGCGTAGVSTSSGSSDSTANSASNATNKTAPTVDVPGGTASASESVPVSEAGKSVSVSKTITLDPGATGSGNTWMLNVAEQMADHIVKSAEGIFFKDNDGDSSMLSSVLVNSNTGEKRSTAPTISGPAEVGTFSGAADFSAFTGCASSGVFHLPAATNPLSMTVFIGRTLASLSRVAVACLTSVDPVRGTVWVNPQAFFALFVDGRSPPATFRMKLTVDESVSSSADANCPFTTCKKFSTLMFTSGSGSSQFGSFPSAFNGDLYLNASNESQFKVATNMTFSSNQSSGPCITMNGFLINVQSNGSEVAGKFQMLLNGSTVTVANGGIATTGTSSSGACSVISASIASTVSAFATGACADSTGTLLAAGACSIDNDPNTLLSDPSTASVEADTAFPSNAPTTF